MALRRLGRKQEPPPERLAAAAAAAAANDLQLQAVRDEAWSELANLGEDVRRQHYLWTHVRTHDATHVQPDRFSREQFWEHLCKVYQNGSGSSWVSEC